MNLFCPLNFFSDNGDQDFIYKIKGKREDGIGLGKIAGTELLKKAGNNFKKK